MICQNFHLQFLGKHVIDNHIFGRIVEFVYMIIEHCTKSVLLDTRKKLWMDVSEVGLDTSMDEHVFREPSAPRGIL